MPSNPNRAISVVVSRRAARLASALPDFVRIGAPRAWIEALESRRILSATVADDLSDETNPVDDAIVVDAVLFSDSVDCDEDVDLATEDKTAGEEAFDPDLIFATGEPLVGEDGEPLDDGATEDEVEVPAVPTSEHKVTTTDYFDIVNDDGDVLGSYKIEWVEFGTDLDTYEPGFFTTGSEDLEFYAPTPLDIGQSVLLGWDETTYEDVVLDALPDVADTGTGFRKVTRVATDDATLTTLRAGWNDAWAERDLDGGIVVDGEDGYVDYDLLGDAGGLPDVIAQNGIPTSTPAKSESLSGSPTGALRSTGGAPLPDFFRAPARDTSDVLTGDDDDDVIDAESGELLDVVG